MEKSQCDSCIIQKDCPYYSFAVGFIGYLKKYEKPVSVRVAVEVTLTECYMDRILGFGKENR